MAAKKLVPFHAPGRRLVYDNDPEAITRPDTVPAALRFLVDDETDAGSGFGHRVQRELSAYPGVPEVTRPNDAPTVVDAPLQRAAMHTPRVTESYPRIASDVPRSGPRHRMVSTVPPPRFRRSRDAASPVAAPPPVAASRGMVSPVAAHGVSPVVAPHAVPRDEQRREARPRSDAPVVARPQRTWPLLLATSVATVLAIVVGTSLADGTLARWSPRGFDAPAMQAHATLVPRISTPAPKTLEPLHVELTPAPATDDVPVVRLEDLPVAEQDDGSSSAPPRKTLRGRRGLPRATVRK